MGLTRANIGCGSIQPENWANFDLETWDVRNPPPDGHVGRYRSAVCSFMLQELDFHELPGALLNVKACLQPGGVLRVLVPDIERAWAAYLRSDRDWFPQDERTGGLHPAFCSYLTWFGTVRSVFTPDYLGALLAGAGFGPVESVGFGETWSADPKIVELDSRPKEAMIYEATA